jgi:hypothetical protein
MAVTSTAMTAAFAADASAHGDDCQWAIIMPDSRGINPAVTEERIAIDRSVCRQAGLHTVPYSHTV